MSVRNLCLATIVIATFFMPTSLAWALGLILSETKQQLKLDYEISAVDLGTGRVTVNLTIADQGRLKPLQSVDLYIPSQDGTGYADLLVSLDIREVDGKQMVRAHLLKKWAERAKIRLVTGHLDGKQQALTSYCHEIPIAEHIKPREQKKKSPAIKNAKEEEHKLPAAAAKPG